VRIDMSSSYGFLCCNAAHRRDTEQTRRQNPVEPPAHGLLLRPRSPESAECRSIPKKRNRLEKRSIAVSNVGVVLPVPQAVAVPTVVAAAWRFNPFKDARTRRVQRSCKPGAVLCLERS
jgi:hypothetical protein